MTVCDRPRRGSMAASTSALLTSVNDYRITSEVRRRCFLVSSFALTLRRISKSSRSSMQCQSPLRSPSMATSSNNAQSEPIPIPAHGTVAQLSAYRYRAEPGLLYLSALPYRTEQTPNGESGTSLPVRMLLCAILGLR